MRCKGCNSILPPHLILNDAGEEEDLCNKCLSWVYSDHEDIVNKDYTFPEHELEVSGILQDNEEKT